jgi:hypothetical protein
MNTTKPLTLFVVTAFFVTAVVISLMASTYTEHIATPGGSHGKISMTAPPGAQKEFSSVSRILEKGVVHQGNSGE